MLEWLLETANSIVTYRARYRRMPELLPVMHLLVFDTTNPHSVAFQVHALLEDLAHSAHELGHTVPPQVGILERRLARFDLTSFETEHSDDACARLATLLGDAEQTAYALSDDVHHRFFIHTVPASRLGSAA